MPNMTKETRTLDRETVDREITYARTGGAHPSVRVVTLERVLAITDAKTEALKEIHRVCNRLLDTEGAADFKELKYIRELASVAWPALQRSAKRGYQCCTICAPQLNLGAVTPQQ